MIDTRIFNIDGNNPDAETVRQAADIIKNGGLLAFPTETVYGLGADATDPAAASRIYEAKGRPSDNPLIVHISDFEMLGNIAAGDMSRAKRLSDAFWPGPLTIIMERREIIPKRTTGGLDTIAVRMPRPNATRSIIRSCGKPVAAPSANISGRPSPTCARHVIEDFSGRIDGIVDCGNSEIGMESTILDITGRPCILRRGFILKEQIEDILGTEIDVSDSTKESETPKAPGMKYRHYSPKAGLILVTGEPASVTAKIKSLTEASETNKKVAVICHTESKDSYGCVPVYVAGSRGDGAGVMKNLYGILRSLDEDGIEEAYCEAFDESEYKETIMERLIKASAGNVIKA